MNRVRRHVLLLAFGSILTTAPLHATTVPVFLLEWGNAGLGPGEFDNLAGIAAGSGFVYVADSDQARISKFTTDGRFVQDWFIGAPYPAFPPEGPLGIGLDAVGRLFISQHHVHRILRYTNFGTLDFIFGGSGDAPGLFHYPVDVRVDRQGFVWVADQHNHRVQKLTGEGEPLLVIGITDSTSMAPGVFQHPFGVAFDSNGDVYVTDHSNQRVQKFDRDGNFLTMWGAMGTGPGEFNRPTGIAVDPLDNVYVVDSFNNRVQMFTTAGAYLGEFGGTGTEPGKFNFPVNIAIDEGGFIYIGDESNYRIQKFGSKVTPVARATLGQLKARFR